MTMPRFFPREALEVRSAATSWRVRIIADRPDSMRIVLDDDGDDPCRLVGYAPLDRGFAPLYTPLDVPSLDHLRMSLEHRGALGEAEEALLTAAEPVLRRMAVLAVGP